ncbi:MAG: lysophospholipid acyltransferase family protein [Acidimicrobiales bacterium]
MAEAPDLVLNPKKTPLYRFAAALIGGLARFLFHPTVEGVENIPLSGPVVIAPSHRSNVDFALTLFVSPRKTFFMAKDGIYRQRWFGEVLTRLGAFPVRRDGADRESMRLAEEVLRRGQALVLFPEGTRKSGPTIETLHDGAMFIAARTGATVVPVGIAGTERAMPKGAKLPRFSKVNIVVGKPIAPPSGEGRVSRTLVAEKTVELQRALQEVYDESVSRQR